MTLPQRFDQNEQDQLLAQTWTELFPLLVLLGLPSHHNVPWGVDRASLDHASAIQSRVVVLDKSIGKE
jgi:hypothetical protein